MNGQMCWLAEEGAKAAKVLHLRLNPHEPWQPYTKFPLHAAPDYPMPGGSLGWATYQKLLKAGWALISVAEAQKTPALATALLRR